MEAPDGTKHSIDASKALAVLAEYMKPTGVIYLSNCEVAKDASFCTDAQNLSAQTANKGMKFFASDVIQEIPQNGIDEDKVGTRAYNTATANPNDYMAADGLILFEDGKPAQRIASERVENLQGLVGSHGIYTSKTFLAEKWQPRIPLSSMISLSFGRPHYNDGRNTDAQHLPGMEDESQLVRSPDPNNEIEALALARTSLAAKVATNSGQKLRLITFYGFGDARSGILIETKSNVFALDPLKMLTSTAEYASPNGTIFLCVSNLGENKATIQQIKTFSQQPTNSGKRFILSDNSVAAKDVGHDSIVTYTTITENLVAEDGLILIQNGNTLRLPREKTQNYTSGSTLAVYTLRSILGL